ncbi:MAG: fused MFS/spermidine synthase [Bacteroidota bacterium]
MKAPFPKYKKWLSYATEQVLETVASEHNEFLQVSLVQGRLQLVAEDAIYSFGDYYLNFRKLFELFDFEQLPLRSEVLILGLGLGSIPELLEDYIGVEYHYVAVEIDPVIIQLATKYSLPKLQSPVEVQQADAYAFLQVDPRQYDLICVDVFQDATVPEHLNGDDFLELLKAHLKPNGAIAYNRIADNREHAKHAMEYYEGPFQKAFPNATLYNTRGNYMLINEARFIEQ